MREAAILAQSPLQVKFFAVWSILGGSTP